MSAVYLTGLGVAAPNGLGAARYWAALLAGRSGISEITRFDARRYPAWLAGQILDFAAREHLPGRLRLQTDVSTQLALAAADWALCDAGLPGSVVPGSVVPGSGVPGSVVPGSVVPGSVVPGSGVPGSVVPGSVVTANALGGFEFTHRELRNLWTEGPRAVSVYESFAWFYAVNTGQISIRNGLRGANRALVGEQAAGLDAIGQARRCVRGGGRLALAGGVDSALDPWGWVAQLSGGRVSRDPDPGRAYRPFDRTACGYLPGEGGALLVLESCSSARARGAFVYGSIAGYAATFDPPPGSGRPPSLRRAIELALGDAGLAPSQVSVVFADAAGVPALDRAEAEAISGVFGPRGVPVTAPKTLTGRLYGGGGPLDVAAAALSIRDGIIPATSGTRSVPAEYGLDLVTGAPRAGQPVSCALVLARGQGGFNAAVVLRAAR